MDYALVNVEQPHRLLRAYEKTHAFAVAPDFDAIASLGVTPVPGKFLSETEVLASRSGAGRECDRQADQRSARRDARRLHRRLTQ